MTRLYKLSQRSNKQQISIQYSSNVMRPFFFWVAPRQTCLKKHGDRSGEFPPLRCSAECPRGNGGGCCLSVWAAGVVAVRRALVCLRGTADEISEWRWNGWSYLLGGGRRAESLCVCVCVCIREAVSANWNLRVRLLFAPAAAPLSAGTFIRHFHPPLPAFI